MVTPPPAGAWPQVPRAGRAGLRVPAGSPVLLGPQEPNPRWPPGRHSFGAQADKEPGSFPSRLTLLGSAPPVPGVVTGAPRPPPFDNVYHTLPDVNAPSVRFWRGGEPGPFPGTVQEASPSLSGHGPGLPPSRPASCGRVRHLRCWASWELWFGPAPPAPATAGCRLQLPAGPAAAPGAPSSGSSAASAGGLRAAGRPGCRGLSSRGAAGRLPHTPKPLAGHWQIDSALLWPWSPQAERAGRKLPGATGLDGSGLALKLGKARGQPPSLQASGLQPNRLKAGRGGDWTARQVSS
ncbi:collagen alpha-1(III) chain-like [Ursus arctos]|uniref:collagen alpha-1(III) chain-like n=1 Tax=Ursus arctos TaxID=9644 RepID=UPI002547F814|nr:collagen alpha-1(III) chain-like [Ursus arctos]